MDSIYSQQVKIHCESPLWSERLQRAMHKEFGATWGFGMDMPWNTQREWLVVVQNAKTGLWYITWTDKQDFDQVPGPEYSAMGLYHAWVAMQNDQEKPQ